MVMLPGMGPARSAAVWAVVEAPETMMMPLAGPAEEAEASCGLPLVPWRATVSFRPLAEVAAQLVERMPVAAEVVVVESSTC